MRKFYLFVAFCAIGAFFWFNRAQAQVAPQQPWHWEYARFNGGTPCDFTTPTQRLHADSVGALCQAMTNKPPTGDSDLDLMNAAGLDRWEYVNTNGIGGTMIFKRVTP